MMVYKCKEVFPITVENSNTHQTIKITLLPHYPRECNLSAESDLLGLCWCSVSSRQLGRKVAALACQD